MIELCLKPGEDPLITAALWYNVVTEQFDQARCYGRNERGEAIPINARELAAVNGHAKERMKEAREWLIRNNMTFNFRAFKAALDQVDRSPEWAVLLKQLHRKPEW